MKHATFVLSLLALSAGITLPAENIIKNGSFETLKADGSFPADWGIHYIWKGPCEVVKDAAKAHNGEILLHFNQKAPDAHKNFVAFGSSRVPGKAGAKYRLSIWAKGDGAVSMTVYFSAKGKYLSSDGTFPPKTPLQNDFAEVKSEEWQQYSFEFAVPEIQTAITADHEKLAPETIEVLINVKGDLCLDDAELIPQSAK